MGMSENFIPKAYTSITLLTSAVEKVSKIYNILILSCLTVVSLQGCSSINHQKGQ
jgi:hypothetical protein